MSMIKAHSLDMCLMRGGAGEGCVQKIEKFLSQRVGAAEGCVQKNRKISISAVSNAAHLNKPFA